MHDGSVFCLNKTELIAEICKKTEIPAVQTEQVINFAIDIISEKLSQRERCILWGSEHLRCIKDPRTMQ